jgi:hypothetical protein
MAHTMFTSEDRVHSVVTRFSIAATMAAGLLLLPAAASASPILPNGSFEAVQIGSPFFSVSAADIPGWIHTGSPGDALLWAVGYADGNGSITTAGAGNQFVTLGGGFDGAGSAQWSTTITGLTAGDAYVLGFMTATELGTGIEPGGPQTMTVGFSSSSATLPESFTSPDSSAAYWRTWINQDYLFVASASTAVVDFSVTNQMYDMGLDNVTIAPAGTSAPEPASLFSLAGGLVILTGLLRRKRAGQR